MHSERFDVVHAHTTLTNFYILWIARLTGAKKLISHSHNSFVSKIILRSELSMHHWGAGPCR